MELTVDPMSDERIIEALKELKKMWFGKSPSKYQFALGHAIRKFEGSIKKPCPFCGNVNCDGYCGTSNI